MTRLRSFAGPLHYTQGPGALDELGRLLAGFTTPALVCDSYVRAMLGDRVGATLRAAGLTPAFLELTGEISATTADALAADAPSGVDVVVGLGGGKSLDAGKAVALRRGLPVVTVPTVASNDSPTSRAIAMYDDDHRMVAVDTLPTNPRLVVVDTALVAEAPVELLRAGIGDAVSKRWEARACWHGSGVTSLGTRPLRIGGVVADAAYSILREHGVAALGACARGEVTDDLEAVVEAVVLLSGVGFENGGLSLAHSLTRGLMQARGAAHARHGEHVAWATLVQLAAEDDPERADLRELLQRLGLPVSLAALGMSAPTAADVRGIARLTMAAPHLANAAVPITENSIVAAIEMVEAAGRPG